MVFLWVLWRGPVVRGFCWVAFLLVVLFGCCSFRFLFDGLVVSMLSFSCLVFGVVGVFVFGKWCYFVSWWLLFDGFWLLFVRVAGAGIQCRCLLLCFLLVFVFLCFLIFGLVSVWSSPSWGVLSAFRSIKKKTFFS